MKDCTTHSLFTCTAVSAIHLELVREMSAKTKRFIARRDKPEKIISDNANHFKASKKKICMARKDIISGPQVLSYLSGNDKMELHQ